MYHYKPSFMSGVIFGNELFFSDSYINALCVADISTGSCVYIDRFPDEKEEVSLLHSGAFLYKDRIIFAPRRGKHIHSFNLNTKEVNSIELNTGLEEDDHFVFSLLSGDELWLFPQHVYRRIVSYDLNTGKISIHGDFQSKGGIYESGDLTYAHEGEIVFASIGGTSILMEFDINTEYFKFIHTEIGKIINVYQWQGIKWICTRDSIYKQVNESENFEKYDTEEQIEEPVLFRTEGSKDIYAMSAIGGSLYILDRKRFIKCGQTEIERSPTYTDGYMYGEYTYMDGGVLVFPPFGKDCVFINDNNFKKIVFHVKNGKGITSLINKKYLTYGNEPIYERGPISLTDYISLI